MSRAKRILAWTTIVGAACAGLLLISNGLLNWRAEARFQATVKPELSYYYLALEIAEARLGMEITIDAEYWEQIADMSLSEFVAWAKSIAASANLRCYRKHPRGPKLPPPKRTSGKRRAHVSTHRILEARKLLA
jgi:hypothetical protein